ncbi:winged helix-turn-helix domain-containing protein [Natronococcus sp. A-GB7]|uniref:winged helix-turn-helix domain-containing protein n=1 Tax=Natronococcus sp. A-GB7 TaxID=3037649 RepID=UPI00241DE715|nr:winged helix-turn-helix domain-containing protein [Natronococcus sp. A-GB7]MDG5817341.1 winged helix-turn-helix domain-containing protein [Natronococcus sp. A-GB7]
MQPNVGDDPGPVLDLLADPYARRILTAANDEPMTAKALSEACDASLPTIYRRVDTLDEQGLLEETRVVDSDGSHRRVYRTTVESVRATLEGDELRVVVDTRDDLAGNFTDLWEELRGED